MAHSVSSLTRGAIRAEIDALAAKHHGIAEGEPRVVGLHGPPDAALAEDFTHTVAGRSVTVRVAPCESTLAVWEALATRDPSGWLVVITDRPEDDLGTGVLAHFIGQRVRLVDPWLGVRSAFGATGIDRGLTRLTNSRQVAEDLLALVGRTDNWPAAPGGLLTLDHVATAVARRELRLGTGPLDATAVVTWTTGAGATSAMAALRNNTGDAFANVLLTWLAERTDAAALFVRRALAEARPADVAAWGLAAEVIRSARSVDAAADAAWEKLRSRGAVELSRSGVADALGATATVVVGDLLADPATFDRGRMVADRAEELLLDAGAQQLAAASALLPHGLQHRFDQVASALGAEPNQLMGAWSVLRAHAQIHHAPPGRLDSAFAPTAAAVRLRRWLDTDDTTASTLAAAARRQVAEDAWVDSAIHDAAGGVTQTALSVAIAEVVARARARRAAHDTESADALARSTDSTDGLQGPFASGDNDDPVLPLEHVLRDCVVPLAKERRALLLVLDGMTARVAAELMEDLKDSWPDWAEMLWPGHRRRAAAVALLPTITQHSRTSLLCGRIASGNQQTERTEHPKLVASLGGGTAKIFHKAELDQNEDGHRLAIAVRDAITNEKNHLVTCVLNTIDDALDRSDPDGTEWRISSITHLAPLLELARAVGRPVVLTSDHGHVVERRKGRLDLPAGTTATSARSRTPEVPARDGEVLVRGERVAGGETVLAVDELLRYLPLKAGYHGGAAAAEMAVPVILLWPTGWSSTDQEAVYQEAPIQRPPWWDLPLVAPFDPMVSAASQEPIAEPPEPQTLFEYAEQEPATDSLGAQVTGSTIWAAQWSIAGRISLSTEAFAALLDQLAAAPGTRLSLRDAARVLNVAEQRAKGAVNQLQKVANVDGYAVIRLDGDVVVLDLPLLAEQFEVNA